MKHRYRAFFATPVVTAVLVICAPQAAAQLSVFDPLNYQENLLSAARALEQINNQVRQLQNQAQIILRMDQNLLRLGSTISPDLQLLPLRSPAQALQVGDVVVHDGYELPSIRTDVIEQVDVFGPGGHGSEIDFSVFPLHAASWQ
jgi:hypothetical protein